MKVTKQFLKKLIMEELLKEKYIEPPSSYSIELVPEENRFFANGVNRAWMPDEKNPNMLNLFHRKEGYIWYGSARKDELVDELNKLGIKHNIK